MNMKYRYMSMIDFLTIFVGELERRQDDIIRDATEEALEDSESEESKELKYIEEALEHIGKAHDNIVNILIGEKDGEDNDGYET